MERRTFPVVPAVLLGLCILGAVGMWTFLAPCGMHDGAWSTCHWAGQALKGLFIVMGCCALLGCVLKDRKARAACCLCLVPCAALTALVPNTLIRLCMMSGMRCLSVMLPGARVLGCAIALVALVGGLMGLLGRKE